MLLFAWRTCCREMRDPEGYCQPPLTVLPTLLIRGEGASWGMVFEGELTGWEEVCEGKVAGWGVVCEGKVAGWEEDSITHTR